ncbi:Uncharacterised protein [uncultured archaeon]|nr:Uncharacterised protein [uncultured archaeon]
MPKAAGTKKPLEHAYNIGSNGLGLIHCGLCSHIDLADLIRLKLISLHQIKRGHGSHGSGILMRIGNGHSLNSNSAGQFTWIDVPGFGELS